MGKDKNDDMGCVGFGSGGLAKQSNIHVFFTSDGDPSKILDEHRVFYGNGYTLKYITTDNPEKIYEKFMRKIDSKDDDFSHLVSISNKTASDILRDFAGSGKKLKTFGRLPKSKKNDDGDKKSKSNSKKGSDDDSDDEKKKKSNKKSKDNESDSDSGSDGETAKKKKTTSKKTNKKSKKVVSDSDSDSD
jgi:hypothetical protein